MREAARPEFPVPVDSLGGLSAGVKDRDRGPLLHSDFLGLVTVSRVLWRRRSDFSIGRMGGQGWGVV